MKTPEQLSFNLPFRTARSRGDFFVSHANTLAVQMLDDWQSWLQRKLICIGPEGSGKTHLAHIWAEMVAGHVFPADIPFDIPGDGAAIAVDGIDLIAKNPAAQERLFHLHNHLQATGGTLLMTARCGVTEAGFTLPDMLSRLQATAVVEIESPDDTLLGVVLLKHFADRQLTPPASVIPYLLRHMDRSFQAAADVVNKLDRLALDRKRPITRAMAVEVLETP